MLGFSFRSAKRQHFSISSHTFRCFYCATCRRLLVLIITSISFALLKAWKGLCAVWLYVCVCVFVCVRVCMCVFVCVGVYSKGHTFWGLIGVAQVSV